MDCIRLPPPDGVSLTRHLAPARAALDRRESIVVPTDTVYGLASHAMSRSACEAMYRAKGRSLQQPTAILFATPRQVQWHMPGLSPEARLACDALLPGPYTLVVQNRDEVAPWLCGTTPHAVGVRVPRDALPLPPIAATSANAAGQRPATTVEGLPISLEGRVAVAIDAGPLTGHPSTVIDITAWERGGEIVVLRDPAGFGDHAVGVLERLVK